MKNQRAFHPTGDQLESREVLSTTGVRASLAHAMTRAPLQLSSPFAHTLSLGTGLTGTVTRSVTTVARPTNAALRGANAAALVNASALAAFLRANSSLLNNGLNFQGGVPNLISGLTFPGAVPNQISGLSFQNGFANSFANGFPSALGGLNFQNNLPGTLVGQNFRTGFPSALGGLNFQNNLPGTFGGFNFQNNLPGMLGGTNFL